jgi:uncharacterized protein YfaS (alpha-2-macroglobulin family)
VDFLARAKGKGYAVPDEALTRAYTGMDSYESNGSWRTEVFWTPMLQPQYRRDPVLTGQAYADYVLARAKRADIGSLRYLHDNSFERLEPAAKAELGAALAMMGDKARAGHALDAAERELMQPQPVWSWAGDYYRTRIRDLAIVLTLSAEIGDTDRMARLTAQLEGLDTRTDTLTTQEQAWLSVAAATVLAKAGPLDVSVGRAAATPMPPPMTLRPDDAAIAAGFTLKNQGQGPIYRAVTAYGVPTAAPSAMESGVTLTKTVTAMDGTPVDLNAVKQNDRLVVHLSGHSDDDAYHQDILVDMLPAGWEIEAIVPPNRKNANNGFPWLGAITPTKSAQKRDDRFVAALDLGTSSNGRMSYRNDDDDDEVDKTDPKAFNLAYVVRAITPGSFVLPAAVAQDMYRPPVMARTAVGTLTVTGKP